MGEKLELVGLINERSESDKFAEEEDILDEVDGTSAMSSATKPDGLIQRLMLRLDERVSVKLLMRAWGPRLEFVVRLMLVATFLDDSFRMMTHFSEHTEQVGTLGWLKWLAATSPILAGGIATVALGIGLLAQSCGSLCLLALLQPNHATKALIGWVIVQPMLYMQLANFELVAESLSLIGGLLMLRVHLQQKQKTQHHANNYAKESPAWQGAGALTQLLGRLLLPAAYLYQAGLFLFSALTRDETNNVAMYISSLSMFIVNTAVLVGLVTGSILVAAGLKSRAVALMLALVNLGLVCYQHPIWRFVSREGGEWKIDTHMWMPNVELPTDEFDFDPWQIYDLHRYYFFLGLSTSGALLLLAQFGPGEIAVQKHETILPVLARAQD